MSYRIPHRALGAAISPTSLLPSTVTQQSVATALREGMATSAIRPNSGGFDLAPRDVQDSVVIQVPASCGNTGTLVEGTKFPVAGAQILPGKLYVISFPLNKRLNATQRAIVEQQFLRRMTPVAADFPVPVTTPCDLGARKSDACACRDRKNPQSWYLQKPGNVSDSFEVQKCRSTAEKNRARAWISFFHQLWGSQDLPWGYQEVSGQPTFVYTVSLNPDPRIPLYNEDGTIKSGNLAVKPPQLPRLSRHKVYATAYNNLGQAMVEAGFKRTDVAPSAVLEVDRWDSSALAEEMDRFTDAMNRLSRLSPMHSSGEPAAPSTPEQLVREFKWNQARYFEGKREKASGLDQMYSRVIDEGIRQASAYGRDSVMAIWGSLAGLFVYAFTSRVTDSFARSLLGSSKVDVSKFQRATLAIVQSDTVLKNVKALAPQLIDDPNPQNAYGVIKELRKAFQRSISDIQTGQQLLPQAPALLQRVFDGVKRMGVEIKRGLEEAKVKMKQRAPGLDPVLQRRFECKLYAKAKNEQQTWPRRLLDVVPPLQASIQSYAQLHPKAGGAIASYQAALKELDEIESQLNLAWWAKDLGPLPVWAWGGIGVVTFVGGAAYLRSKRKKKVKPNRSLKDLAPIAQRIARTENYNDQAVARALRAELGDEAPQAAKFAHIAAKGQADANFWRDVQTLFKLGYNRGRAPRRRRRSSRRRRTSRRVG